MIRITMATIFQRLIIRQIWGIGSINNLERKKIIKPKIEHFEKKLTWLYKLYYEK